MPKEIATAVAPAFDRKLRTDKHKVPKDLRKALISTPVGKVAWEDITPLARIVEQSGFML